MNSYLFIGGPLNGCWFEVNLNTPVVRHDVLEPVEPGEAPPESPKIIDQIDYHKAFLSHGTMGLGIVAVYTSGNPENVALDLIQGYAK